MLLGPEDLGGDGQGALQRLGRTCKVAPMAKEFGQFVEHKALILECNQLDRFGQVLLAAIVKALNHHVPAPDDPDYPWHGCAQRSLRGIRFPVSETAGPVQVRLTLR